MGAQVVVGGANDLLGGGVVVDVPVTYSEQESVGPWEGTVLLGERVGVLLEGV